jgi:hypothetical protein
MYLHRMMSPAILLVPMLIWLGVLITTVCVFVLRLSSPDERRQAYATFFWILLFTVMFPLFGAPMALFDDFAVRRWFPQGTPGWFMGVELGAGLFLWLAVVAAIARRSPLNWWALGVLFGAVSVAMLCLWQGISYP